MKYFILSLALVVLFGCQPAPTPAPTPNVPTPIVVSPPAPDKDVNPPVAPSNIYLKGYNDGYYGTWLAPGKWTVNSEYRAGWSAGNFDRKHNKPHKYNP